MVIQVVQFPTPLPSEDFRSVLYRYHLYSLNPEIEDTNKELFGARRISFAVFPRGLNVLMSKFPKPNLLGMNTIIENHTLIPLFLPFMAEERMSDIKREVEFGGSLSDSYVGKLAGNKYGKCISDYIRYCPSCIVEDITKYGCSYIHRDHQLAFFSTCRVHSIKLVTHCSTCNEVLMYSPISGKCTSGHSVSSLLSWEENDILEKEIHSDIQYLLANYNGIKNWTIKQRFLEYLQHKGYLSQAGGRIRRVKLANEFLESIPNEFMDKLGINEAYVRKKDTLERTFWREALVTNLPLNLLLIRFLAGGIERFVENGVPYTCEIPFMDGPWHCKNKYCPSYCETTIQRCSRVGNGSRGIVGRFRCPVCEGEYKIEWRWRYGYIKSDHKNIIYSEEKEQQVKEMLNSGISKDDISKKLFCSPGYVRALAKNNKVKSQISHYSSDNIADKHEKEMKSLKKKQFRGILLSVIRQNLGLNRSMIHLECKTQYEWLRRNDREWFEEHLPSSKSYERINWSEVDATLELQVGKVARQLIASNPRTRVSKYSIMGALNQSERGRIKSYIKHLPKTQQALHDSAETTEQYQIRHLPALVWQLRNYYNYKEVTLDTILSYRRSYRGISDQMREVLSEQLKLL